MRIAAGKLAIVCAMLGAQSAAALAQTSQPFSLQASALVVTPSGSAFEGTNAGIGVELQLRKNISEWSIGGGVQYSRHDLDGISDPLSLTGVFFEPRYVVNIKSERMAPYLSGRLAAFRQSVTSDGVSSTANGAQLNGGGGILISATPRVNIDLGVTFGYLKFGDFTNRFEGQTVKVPGGSGTNIVLRAGLAIGIGK
jgi:hypothetical protein